MAWTYPVYTHEVVGKVNPFYYLNNSVFVFAITSILNMCYFSKRRVYTYKCMLLAQLSLLIKMNQARVYAREINICRFVFSLASYLSGSHNEWIEDYRCLRYLSLSSYKVWLGLTRGRFWKTIELAVQKIETHLITWICN